MNKKNVCIGVAIVCLIYIICDPFPIVADDVVAGIIGAVNLLKVIKPLQIKS